MKHQQFFLAFSPSPFKADQTLFIYMVAVEAVDLSSGEEEDYFKMRINKKNMVQQVLRDAAYHVAARPK
jgi:hypothetical protein